MITLEHQGTNVFGFRVSGKLTRDDYRQFLPLLEKAIDTHGPVSVFVDVESLSGIELGALWEELKFDLKHFHHFNRVAVVADGKWFTRSVAILDHMTSVDSRSFPRSERDDAWEWILAAGDASDRIPVTERLDSILFATDFSDNAGTAMKWAMMLARAHDAPLTVMHVAPVTVTAHLPLKVQTQIARRLEQIEEIAGDQGIDVTSEWNAGKRWARIVAAARDHELLVIGARGHTNWPHHPLGGTAEHLVRSATVPVLTVPHDEAWEEQMPRRILVPTDFSESASLALNTTAQVFGSPPDGGLSVTLLHAWQPLATYAYGDVPLLNPYVDTEDQALEMLKGQAERIRTADIEVTPLLRLGYPVKAIEHEAEVLNPDLVAMGTHGHSGVTRFMLGSVTNRLVGRVQCPVLTVGIPHRAGRNEPKPNVREQQTTI